MFLRVLIGGYTGLCKYVYIRKAHKPGGNDHDHACHGAPYAPARLAKPRCVAYCTASLSSFVQRVETCCQGAYGKGHSCHPRVRNRNSSETKNQSDRRRLCFCEHGLWRFWRRRELSDPSSLIDLLPWEALPGGQEANEEKAATLDPPRSGRHRLLLHSASALDKHTRYVDM